MKFRKILTASVICVILLMQAGLAFAADNNINSQELSKKEARPKKEKNKDGSIPAKWNLPKPKAKAHPDVAPETAGGSGDGQNDIDFTYFDSGDIIVTQGTATGHAGVWDWTKYYNIDCLWVPGGKLYKSGCC